jgi:prepilin-type N-terminal cleavage/methylation domain-containing protein
MNASPQSAGFSLIEVMIAVLILGVAVAGLTQGFSTALASSKESEQQTAAALFAAGQIETLRATTGLVDATTEGDCGDELPLYRWRQTISPTGIDGLHEVSVAVDQAQTGALIYELKTLLFEAPVEAPDKNQKPKARPGSGA